MVIVGGSAAKKGEIPWQVLIENMNNAEICGGVIINEKFVLTAAHCTELFRNIDASMRGVRVRGKGMEVKNTSPSRNFF